MIERKESLETSAGILGLDRERVRELVAAEQDRRELRGLRCDSIPVERTRAAIADALARDPHLTIADIARWMEMAQADFERAFLGTGRTGAAEAARERRERKPVDDRAGPCAQRTRGLLIAHCPVRRAWNWRVTRIPCIGGRNPLALKGASGHEAVRTRTIARVAKRSPRVGDRHDRAVAEGIMRVSAAQASKQSCDACRRTSSAAANGTAYMSLRSPARGARYQDRGQPRAALGATPPLDSTLSAFQAPSD